MQTGKLIKKYFMILAAAVMSLLMLTGCGTITDSDEGNQDGTSYPVNYESTYEAGTYETDQSDDNVYADETEVNSESEEYLDENGSYSSKEDVALYIHLYNKLPSNFITKKKAEALGWDNKEGNLWDVTDKMSIGGDRFGNYEGLLPEKDGRKYYECDIDYDGGYRGAKRIIYSNDGLIFYTDDHYETFSQLY